MSQIPVHGRHGDPVALASPSDCSGAKAQRTPAQEACFESRIAEKAAMEEDLRNLTARLEPLETQAVQIIKTFTGEPHRTAMIWHFIRGFSWESVAVRVSYSVRHVHRLRNEALDMITLPDDAIWLE